MFFGIKLEIVPSVDGDRKAYYESSQYAMKKNKDVIAKLREKNKRLRADLAKKKAVSLIPVKFSVFNVNEN